MYCPRPPNLLPFLIAPCCLYRVSKLSSLCVCIFNATVRLVPMRARHLVDTLSAARFVVLLPRPPLSTRGSPRAAFLFCLLAFVRARLLPHHSCRWRPARTGSGPKPVRGPCSPPTRSASTKAPTSPTSRRTLPPKPCGASKFQGPPSSRRFCPATTPPRAAAAACAGGACAAGAASASACMAWAAGWRPRTAPTPRSQSLHRLAARALGCP